MISRHQKHFFRSGSHRNVAGHALDSLQSGRSQRLVSASQYKGGSQPFSVQPFVACKPAAIAVVTAAPVTPLPGS
ncbi:MAG: hypothetical protein R3A47_00840 [Polyangiales bacterium]